MRVRALVLALAAMAAAAPTRAAAGQVAWRFHVKLAPETGTLDVELAIEGWSGARVCADMPGAGKAIVSMEQYAGAPRGEYQPLTRDPKEPDCFLLLAPSQELSARLYKTAQVVLLRYRSELGRLAGHFDPDRAARIGNDWIFTDEAALVRPDPLPRGGIEVTFELPDGYSVSVPWLALDKSGRHFGLSSQQYDAGTYVTVGHLRTLGELVRPSGTARLAMIDRPRQVPDDVVRRWIEQALLRVEKFYGALPGGSLAVTLVPSAGSTQSGIFGCVLRRAAPSVVLFFGADARDPAAFDRDWVATHELFHLGNPRTVGHVNWLAEGFTTYYTDVLRGRARAWSPAAMWDDFLVEMGRNCQPSGGMSLADESHALDETHRYDRVYWGGACLALRLDVAIRERSGGARSLDDVMRALREVREPLDEDEVVAALDRESGGLASAHLSAKTPLPLDALFARLGVARGSGGEARLDDKAPLARVRRAIMEEGETTAKGAP